MVHKWPTKKLGEVISFEKGKKMSVSENKTRESEPYIGIENLRTNTYLLYTQEKNGVHCEPEEVLLVWDGAYAGTVGIGLRGFVGSTIVKVLHNNSLNNRFLVYLLNYNQVKIRSAAQGAAVPHLNKNFINNFNVPLPAIEIQQKISERLDAIKKAQELNARQIALADELFQSLLQDELDSKKWSTRKLGEYCEVNPKTGLDLSKKNTKYVEMAAIDANLKEIKYFSERPIDKISSGLTRFRNGDIIFARITPCTENGKFAFVENCPNTCVGSTEFHILRTKQDELLPRFLFYWLNTPKIKKMAVASMIGSTGRQRVPAEFFHYIKIPLPPLETQRQIVEKLQAVQDYKKKLLEQKTKLKELFNSCLNKAMKGELVS